MSDHTISGTNLTVSGQTVASTVNLSASVCYLCPDLLRLDQLGVADSWRGRAVRTFFRVLKTITGV